MATATSYTKAGIDARAAAPSDDTPEVADGSGFAGTSTQYARADHVHPMPPIRPTVLGRGGLAPLGSTIPDTGGNTNSSSWMLGRLYFCPTWIARMDGAPAEITSVAVHVKTSQPDSSVQIGLYDAAPATGMPHGLLLDTGSLPVEGTGALSHSPAVAPQLPTGLYWFCVTIFGDTTAPTLMPVAPQSIIPRPPGLNPNQPAFGAPGRTAGPLPATWTDSLTSYGEAPAQVYAEIAA